MEKRLLLKNRFSRTVRRVWGLFFIAASVLVIAGAVYVPFAFESQTLRYQFGLSRKLLITGHAMGVTAAVLLFFQLILVSRIRFFDKIFSINRLLLQHRVNAAVIPVLALTHFLLILNTLGAEVLAWDISQWPEFTGLLLLVMLTGISLSGFLRNYIGFPFRFWIFFHRLFAPLAIFILCVHVYFVSETFHHGGAKILIFCFITLGLCAYLFNRLRRISILRCEYSIDRVYDAGKDIHSVELIPANKCLIINVPGQFAFLKIKSGNIPGEEHPFTISSAPTSLPPLQFTVRSSGDWTAKIGKLKRGEKAFISGPFGIFGHIDYEASREMIMIAGGIGITPMLSILRYLSDTESCRKVTLLWSMRTQKEFVYEEEFKKLEKSLPGLRTNYIFTRENRSSENIRRLNEDSLKTLTSGCSRDSLILLCGPPNMMTRVKKILISLGFPRRSVVTERFAL